MTRHSVMFTTSTLAIILPILGGLSYEAGNIVLAICLFASEVIAIGIGLLAYLTGPGDFQRVDIEAEQRRNRKDVRDLINSI